MKNTALARRYAAALVDIGKEDNAYDKYGKELRDIYAVFAGSPVLYKVLLNPMYKLEERVALSVKVAEAIGASVIVTRFLSVLVEARNIKLLDAICASYARLEDELAGRVRATVSAASELDEELMNSIKDKLKAETKKDVVVTFEKNPALIGGVVIRLGNTVLDGSIKSQLDNMKEKLLEGAS
jgi:F-type H+-transporting ATPase subunit delta